MPPKKLDLFYILIFVALNAILKSLYINYAEISLDEPFSIMVALMPLTDIPAFLSQYNNPPLFEFILHPVVTLFGPLTPAVRVPSFVFTCITVVFVYLIGTRFFSRKTGVFASLFFTFSTFHTYFSHEAGSYALFNLLTCISVFLFLCIKDKERFSYHHILLAIFNVSLAYAHYFGFAIWLLELSWLFVFRWRNSKIGFKVVIVFVASAVLYIPQVLVVLSSITSNTETYTNQTPSIDNLYYNLMKMLNAPVTTVMVLAILAAALIKLVVNRKTVVINENKSFVIHWFVTAYFGLFILSLFIPVFLDRYLIFVSVALYLCLAISIDYVWGDELSWPVQGIFVLLFVFSTNLKPDHERRWKGLVETVAASKTNKTSVFILPSKIAINYAYHYNLSYFTDYINTTSHLQQEGYYPVNRLTELASIPTDSLDQVILVDGDSQFVDKTHPVYKSLKQRFPEVSINRSFVGADVYIFHK